MCGMQMLNDPYVLYLYMSHWLHISKGLIRYQDVSGTQGSEVYCCQHQELVLDDFQDKNFYSVTF